MNTAINIVVLGTLLSGLGTLLAIRWVKVKRGL